MFSQTETTPSTGFCSAPTARLQQALLDADAVVVGAGAGLAEAAGFSYAGARFAQHFSDFSAKYHFRDMYSAGFYPYPTPEEYWAYWSRHIYWNRYAQAPGPLYARLLELVRKKDYFILTTNVDHCFQRAGFAKERLFYTQGDYGLWQCSLPCHQKTYDNESAVRQMVERQQALRIPPELVPHCPVCSRPLTMNLRCDAAFAEDEGWHRALTRYQAFLGRHRGRRVLFWELGVGGNTPAIIKYPFWRFTLENPAAVYACVNLRQAYAPPELGERALCIQDDIGAVLEALG